MYLCVRGIDSASFYDTDICFWNCSHIVVFLNFHFSIGTFLFCLVLFSVGMNREIRFLFALFSSFNVSLIIMKPSVHDWYWIQLDNLKLQYDQHNALLSTCANVEYRCKKISNHTSLSVSKPSVIPDT
jgi:hypothetical protein